MRYTDIKKNDWKKLKENANNKNKTNTVYNIIL